MRKIILNLAMSIDGYIADLEGGYAWIQGDGENLVSTEKRWDFPKFLEDIDTVVMGKSCYEQGMHSDFTDKKVIVVTHHKQEDEGNIVFCDSDPVAYIKALKTAEGKAIYIFGGGKVADPFIRQDCIDEYIIGIIPILLGTGIPLFYPKEQSIKLVLTDYSIEDGIMVNYYKRVH